MKNLFIKYLLVFVFVSGLVQTHTAQNVTSCNNSQNFCNNPAFPMTVGGTGIPGLGNTVSNPFSNPQGVNSGCMFANVPGPQWMILTVSANGNLGFSLGQAGSPNPQAGYYDWILWPVTGNLATTCANIFAGTQAPTACNWNCTSGGGTGMGTVPAGASACNYQPSVPVTAGQQFIFLFSNYSGVNGSVTFQSTGTAGLSCSPLIVPSVTVCPGQTATTTATWLGITNPTTYTINPGGIVQTSSVISVSALANTVFTVLAASTNTAGQAVNAQTTFSYITNPNITLAITNPTNYCYGSNITFTANPSGATVYSVTGPGVTTTTFNTNNIVIPNSATTNIGTFSLIATYSTGCIGTGTTPVNVSGNHSLTVNSTSNICQGGTVNLTALMPAAGNPTAYAWVGPNAFSSSVQNPTLNNIQPLSSGIYTVSSNINFNGKQCPRTNTTQVNVVATNSVNVTPSFTLCQGANLNLSSSAIGASSYSWAGPAYSSVIQNPLISSVMPANAGNYTATAFFTNGVITCSQNAVSNVSVVATSPVAVTLPNNICQYDNATGITANAPGAISYSWFGPNNFTSTATTNSIPNIQPIATGPYFATAMFAIGTVSCTITGSNQISVVPVNSITVIPNITVCEPSGATFLASSPGAVTYSWSGPGSYTSNVTNPQFLNLNPSNSGNYTVTTSYNNGILTCYNTNVTSLLVNPILTFTLPPYQQVCYNSPLLINGPAGATSYTWTGSSGFSSNLQDLQIPNIQASQAGVYQLEVNLGPCKTNQSINIDVLSPMQFSLTPDSRTICRGDSVKFVMGSTNGSGNYAYVWNPQTYLGSPTGSMQIGMPLATTIYQVAGHDIACPQFTLGYTFTVNVNQPPMPDLVLDKVQGCEPLCLFYNTKTQSEAAITTYDFGGIYKMQADSFNFCLEQPGTYNLKIYSKGINGCSGVYDFPSPIVVFPKPHSDFSWTPDLVTTTDNQVTFKPSSKYGPVVNTTWQFTGSTITGIDTTITNSPQRTYENYGKYPVMLMSTTDKGCKDTVVKFLEVVEDLNIFIPNTFTPNGDGLNDIFNIKGVGFKIENFSMEIFDRWGTAIYYTKDVMKGWDGMSKSGMSQDAVYIYKIKVVGASGQGKKEYVGHVTLIK
ncbi:MAG: gliding motility-associated C-terminal domain-containing protein [Bacteroidota bacterium]|nr:gliding motility-associated C-terminal domain-containing protein [Bacteroidota bacterium]